NLLKMNQTTYQSELPKMENIDHLFLLELPPSLDKLKDIVRKTQPNNIFVSYQLDTSAYLKTFPTRESFKQLYIYLRKRKQIHITQEIDQLVELTGWEKDNLQF